MLLWRRKDRPNQWRLIRNIFIFSSCLHGMIFFVAFFCWRGTYDHYAISINSRLLDSNARVVFMPFYKPVEKKVVLSKVVSMPAKVKKKKSTSPGAKALADKKKTPTTLALEIKKKESTKKVKPKMVKPKPVKLAKVKNKKVIPVEKPEPVYVGRTQLDALHMQIRMQQEVLNYWQPPAGVSKECECVIKIVVGTDGRAADLELLSSSDVLMYDVSARSAMLAMQLPPWAAGKEFTITFKQ